MDHGLYTVYMDSILYLGLDKVCCVYNSALFLLFFILESAWTSLV